MFKHQKEKKEMNTTKKFFALALVGMAVACNNAAPEANVQASEAQEVTETTTASASVYNVVTEGDEIAWVGYKTFNIGDSHNGTIQVSEGSFTMEEGNLVGGEFTIDMGSIKSLDLAENQEYAMKLEGHLKSPDFFAVDSFPTANFVITGAEAASAEDTTGATHYVTGNLTLKGISKSITIPAEVAANDAEISFNTPEFVIDRSQWDVRFRSTSFTEFADLAKDKVIDNNIKLKISVKASKA